MFDLINDAGMMAHGFCLLWQPWLIALYAGSDLLIFAAYTAIPVALFGFLRRRPDLRDGKMIALFGSFILLCGLAHLVSVVTLWVPLYALHGTLKLVTGLVSVATAAMLFPLVPRLAALPHPAELEAANEALRREGAERRAALADLRRERGRLEEAVSQRTAELAASNERLRALTYETLHRKKNLLTVVQALARQTARTSPSPEAFRDAFSGRLDALARAYGAVAQGSAGAAADLRTVLRDQIEHVGGGTGRVRLSGPPVALSFEAGQQIALAAHELATNALKYGALRGTSGRIAITWRIAPAEDGPRLVLDWREGTDEAHVPLAAAAPAGGASPGASSGGGGREGLGTSLLMRVVPAQLGGRAIRELSSAGLAWRLDVPLSRIGPEAGPDESAGDAPPEAAPALAQVRTA